MEIKKEYYLVPKEIIDSNFPDDLEKMLESKAIIPFKQEETTWNDITKAWVAYCFDHAKDEATIKHYAWLKENYKAPQKL